MLTVRARAALREELARFRAEAAVLGGGRVALVPLEPADDARHPAALARRHADLVVVCAATSGLPNATGADLVFAPAAGELSERDGGVRVAGPDGRPDDALSRLARLLHLAAPDVLVLPRADAGRAERVSAMLRDLDFAVDLVVVSSRDAEYLSPSADTPSTRTVLAHVTATPSALPPMPAWTQVSEKRRAHIARVTALLAEWGPRLGCGEAEAAAMRDVGAWHDALRDAPEPLLREVTGDATSPTALLHGPAAATLLARDGETRADVLDAVRYHTIGHAGWSRVGRALYMADFLEPGRKFATADRAFLATHAPHDFDAAFRQVVRMRLEWSLREGKEIFPETAALWNAVR